MLSKGKSVLLVAMALGSLSPSATQAQGNAAVTGTVTARGSNAPLSGAQVTITGTRLGASTSTDGTFTIRGVEPGPVKVRAQMIGFEPAEQTIQVGASATASVSFALQRTAVTLNGVVITATGEEQRRAIGTAMASPSTARS